ncbi:MAG: glycosyltransferase family 2 protein, partial [Alteripontixanthobacter sp.]
IDEMTQPAETIPDLSVLIVNWNTREMTLECLRSLYAETRETSFETILVDNGSQDGSAEAIAAEFPQVRLLAEADNHGFAKANNMAAQIARGRYVLLLNSDTVVLDGAIDRLMAFAKRTPDAKVWGGRTVFADRSLNIGSAWGKLTVWSAFCFGTGLSQIFTGINLFDPEAMRGWDRSTERQVDIVSGCFFLMERAFWDQLDGFDLNFFMYGEEAELCARARDAGAEPRVTPDATIIHHGGASATTKWQSRNSVCAAKVALAKKHMSPLKAAWVRRFYVMGVALRSFGYRVLSALTGKGKVQAGIWTEVWKRRHEWTRGKLPAR